jgi:hypothetical protein
MEWAHSMVITNLRSSSLLLLLLSPVEIRPNLKSFVSRLLPWGAIASSLVPDLHRIRFNAKLAEGRQ